MSNRERNSTRSTNNPDIASDVHELKALHAEPSVTPPEANRDKTRRVGHFPLVVGGLAVTTAAIVGGYFATKGDADPASAPKKDPEASAPVVPGETEISNEVTLEGVTSKPTAEQVELAKQGIPGDLSVAEAVAYAGDIINIHTNGGEFSFGEGSTIIESESSQAEGDEILTALYGSYLSTTADGGVNSRNARLQVGSRVASAVALGDEPNTSIEWIPDTTSETNNPDGTISIEFDEVISTDIPTLADVYGNSEDRVVAVLSNENNRWYLVSTTEVIN